MGGRGMRGLRHTLAQHRTDTGKGNTVSPEIRGEGFATWVWG